MNKRIVYFMISCSLLIAMLAAQRLPPWIEASWTQYIASFVFGLIGFWAGIYITKSELPYRVSVWIKLVLLTLLIAIWVVLFNAAIVIGW